MPSDLRANPPALPFAPVDLRLRDALQPLADARARLYIPFFANTFPLAFHYFHCLAESGGAELANSSVEFVDWSHRRNLLRADRPKATEPEVFFATQDDLAAIPEVLTHQWEPRFVTKYRPQLIFSEMSLLAQRISLREARLRKDGGHPLFQPIAAELLAPYNSVEVFSDIPDQAEKVLDACLEPPERRKVNVVGPSGGGVCRTSLLGTAPLRLFLYGGPLTTYFERKTRHYLPFRLPDLPRAQIERSFETAVVIHQGCDTNEEELPVLGDAVEKYHELLYATASMATECWQFRTVQEFYNRAARLMQHRSSFSTPCEFGLCLSRHHSAPEVALRKVTA